MKKIVIIGPESTGKTTLVKQLAAHFNCPMVEEYARSYIDQLDRPYERADLLKIAKGQVSLEDKAERLNGEYLFCDTDLRVIKIWSLVKYKQVDRWITHQINSRNYFAYLLMDIDIPWESDPQREHPDQRQQLFDLYYKELEASAVPYKVISGLGQQRLQLALKTIEVFNPERH